MTTAHSDPLLKRPLLPTFLTYLGSSLVGLLAITTANVVDGLFVGNAVGGDALAAITLLLPCLTLLVATALMLAIGGSVRAGNYVGAGDWQKASQIFSQTLIATVIFTVIFACLSWVFADSLYHLLGIPPELTPQVEAYFSVLRWALVVQLFTMVLYYFVRADGHPMLATFALVGGALLNIVLDAWFVLHLNWGLSGAAWATALAQLAQCALLCRYFVSPERGLRFRLWQRRWLELFKAAYNGLSEFINELSVGLLFLLLNYMLLERMGVAGVAAFSVVNYCLFTSVMLCYGIADALHCLVSRHAGAQQWQRAQHFLYIALTIAAVLASTIVCGLWLANDVLGGWFLRENDAQAAALTSQWLGLIWPIFLAQGISILFSCYLTAIQKPRASACIALARGLIFPMGLLLLLFYWGERVLPTWLEVSPDWGFLLALPLAECLALLLAITLYYRYGTLPHTQTAPSAHPESNQRCAAEIP